MLVQSPFCHQIKVGFPLHLGDNLESHSVGGFRTCFSSGSICRYCHIQHDELITRIHDYTNLGPHSQRRLEIVNIYLSKKLVYYVDLGLASKYKYVHAAKHGCL